MVLRMLERKLKTRRLERKMKKGKYIEVLEGKGKNRTYGLFDDKEKLIDKGNAVKMRKYIQKKARHLL
jgi:muconolactone delta-isomerase